MRSSFSRFAHPDAQAIALAVALVVLRAIVYLRFEQISFDSDQAIVGLMAKHLSEGRAFPLFFYGQTYMLGVEAWVAAPIFLIAGPTVGALRLSILAWNIAFAVLAIKGLQRGTNVTPWIAVVPVLFFLAAPPSIANKLMWAQGGLIEPFVYIALLWFLRDRPLWFGAVLAIGFLNREFTIYAVPVLLALEIVAGQLSWNRVRAWLAAAVMFFVVWESVEALKRFADLAGPGTRGQLLGGFGGSQIGNLLARFDWQPGALVERARMLAPDLLAWFVGARQVDTNFPLSDRNWLLWSAAAGGLLLVVRLLWLIGRSPRAAVERAHFAMYLLGVGIVAMAAFIAGKPSLAGYVRYATLGLLVPIGLTAAILALESHPVVRGLVVVAVIAWAALSVTDHTRILMLYARQAPANPAREIADRLVAKHVEVAEAGYWNAYRITFLAHERVRVASQDFVRIEEYQRLAAERNPNLVVSDEPCPGGEPVATVYFCRP